MPQPKSQVNLKYFILNEPASQGSEKPCDVAGCKDSGVYKAPKSRNQLNHYYWFCLPHIRDYNARWDYYADFNISQIEAQIRADAVWQKPTWPFGTHGPKCTKQEPIRIPESIKESLAILELHFPFTLDKLRAQYKKLVKLYHPDLKDSCSDFTEKLKSVNNAYALLRDYLTQNGKAKAT
jgi:hypothetical protein